MEEQKEPTEKPAEVKKTSAYDVELTVDQEKAVDIAKRLTDTPGQVGVLAGYAGTGKTTVISGVSKMLGSCLVLAPTGKAALRVTEATGLSSKTIHRWMYIPKEDEKGNVSFLHKIDYEQQLADKGKEPFPDLALTRPSSGLIVVDEASMVGEKLYKDLVRAANYLDCSILFVGDAFQLPPIVEKGEAPFSVLSPTFKANERVELTEIIRQVEGDPIIHGSLLIRQGFVQEALKHFYQYKANELAETATYFYDHKGVVICHSNETRRRINRLVRERKGLPKEIQKDEPIVITRNNYGLDMFNGEIRRFKGWRKMTKEPVEVKDYGKTLLAHTHFGAAFVEDIYDVSDAQALLAVSDIDETISGFTHRDFLFAMGPALKDLGYTRKNAPPFLRANLGYSLTCHKSQGSEWDNVLVHLAPYHRFHTDEGRRWLYTAVTRAKKVTALITG